MKLYHYTDRPFKLDRYFDYSRHQDGFSYRMGHKPFGLWLSCEDCEEGLNWREWCIENNFNTESLNFVSEIILKPDARILIISTELDFEKLEKAYGKFSTLSKNLEDFLAVLENERVLPINILELKHVFQKSLSGMQCQYIHWKKVQEVYQGILIPKFFEERHNSFGPTAWYNSWDCASGCIWDLDCIESVTDRSSFSSNA